MSATSHTTADRRSRKYRGFSLIELMVGLAISLIGTIAMMAAFASFEGQKRTTASSDDAQQNGSFSLFALEQRIRTAGSGLTQGNRYGVWGCAIAANTGGAAELPLAATLPAPFNTWPLAIKTVPVLIASGGTGPDTIGVIGGNPAIRTFKASISGASGTTVPLNNVLGIATGDYLLNSPNDGTGNCSLGVATTVATAPTGSPAAFPVGLDTSNSPAAGFTLGYVFDIGPQPVFN
ncbi:MAG: PilW family protein, partial [Candidatus Dormibacteria bacterium]